MPTILAQMDYGAGIEQAVLLSVCAFIPVLIGLGIYLFVDAMKNRNRLPPVGLETASDDAPAVTASGVHQLNYQSPVKQSSPVFPDPSSKAVVRCVYVVLAYFLFAIIFIPVYKHFEYVPRRAVFTFVDSATGAPVPINFMSSAFHVNVAADWPNGKCSTTTVGPNVVRIDWDAPTELFVHQTGYEDRYLVLTDDQWPQRQTIELDPKPSAPTQPTHQPAGAGGSE